METAIRLDGRSLTPQALLAVERGASVELSPEARQLVQASADWYTQISPHELLRDKRSWLSGGGVDDATDSAEDLVRDFILGHCAGVGEPLDPTVVRGLIAARANVFAVGCSGVRPSFVEEMLHWLSLDVVPVVPSQGALGGAGSVALAHLAAVLCGWGGYVWRDGARVAVRDVTGLPFLKPNEKEALALINGDTLSVVLAASACVRARQLLETAESACALSFEVVRADRRCLDARAMAARHHPGPIAVAARLRSRLEGSEWCRDGTPPDPFSVRCAPAVLGTAWDALEQVEGVVARELNAAIDNPLVFLGEGLIEAGNFHGAPIALAMDHLKIGLVQVASIAERRIFRLTYGQLSGLPSFLVPGTGLNSGLMLAQYTAASLVSEARGLAHPASVDSIPTVQHREDHLPMSPIAARGALSITELLADVVAIELMCAAQGIDCLVASEGGERSLGRGSAQSRSEVRRWVARWEDDRALHPDLVALGRAVRAGRFSSIQGGW